MPPAASVQYKTVQQVQLMSNAGSRTRSHFERRTYLYRYRYTCAFRAVSLSLSSSGAATAATAATAEGVRVVTIVSVQCVSIHFYSIQSWEGRERVFWSLHQCAASRSGRSRYRPVAAAYDGSYGLYCTVLYCTVLV